MFDPTALMVLNYGLGWTLWLYRTSDPLDEVLAPGYFPPEAASVGKLGTHGYRGRDRIEVVGDDYDATLSLIGAWDRLRPPAVIETAVLAAVQHRKDRAA